MQATQQQSQDRVREMTWDEFEQEFHPIMDAENSTFRMFTKSDWEFLKARSNTHPGTVWTFMDDGEGGTFIGDGLHYVNALHWHVTEMPANPGVAYIVDHDPGSDDEDDDDHDESPEDGGSASSWCRLKSSQKEKP